MRKQVGGWLAQLKLTDALDTALKWLYDDRVLRSLGEQLRVAQHGRQLE